MGLIGGLLLLGGIGAVIVGIIGIIGNLIMWNPLAIGYCILLLIGGLISGALAASILE